MKSMKNFLVIISSLLLAINAISQGLFDSSFTNKAEAKNLIVNGLKEGRWVEFKSYVGENTSDTNAPFYYLIPYSHGEPNGVLRICDKEGVISKSHYNNGVLNGVEEKYDENGNLICILSYTNGRLNGMFKRYYTNGQLWDETPYANGKKNGVTKEYDADGNLKRDESYSDDKMNGVKKDYYKSGAIKDETTFTSGIANGLAKSYYESGRLCDSACFINGKENGVHKAFYEDGRLWMETTYKDDTVFVATKTYDENGNQIENSKPLPLWPPIKLTPPAIYPLPHSAK